MDLMSVGIRTIFYDINIAEVLKEFNKSQHDYFESFFNKLAISRENRFTLTELDALKEYLKQRVGVSGQYKWSQFLKLLSIFGSECLKVEGNEPIVKYEYLNRWHQLSLLIGEDVLVCSFLGNKYVNAQGTPNFSFDWPNILNHDSVDINDLMEDGVADIHAHLGASADVFELTWLDLMHNVTHPNEKYKELLVHNEAQFRFSDKEDNISIPKLIQIAAYLRIHIYVNLQNNNTDGTLCKMLKLIRKEDDWISEINKTQSCINTYRSISTQKNKYEYIDYALHNKTLSKSIFSIHSGERSLLYDFFSGYFAGMNLNEKISDYVFLYIIIKSRIRREFIQTNSYNGFQNFKEYDKRRNKYANDYRLLYNYYAIQSSFRIGYNDKLETRISPQPNSTCDFRSVPIPKENFSLSLFEDDTQSPSYSNISKESLTFVVHLLKKPELFSVPNVQDTSRFGYRHLYRKQIDAIIEEAKKRTNSSQTTIYKIAGLDAAGNELSCPPAVFGHSYRYARARGMVNFTYHVGEDFFDLSDGLMNIYHSILFLNLQENCRLGHAIALGVDPYKYYENRGFQMIANRQKILDILVWTIGFCNSLKITLSKEFREQMTKKAEELYQQIGYTLPFDIDKYYMSQLLRSDDLWCPNEGGSKWIDTRLCNDDQCKVARNNPNSKSLNESYNIDRNIIFGGKYYDSYILPSEMPSVIETIQTALIEMIRKRGIIIESCPTSNLKIGPFDALDELPLYKFMEKGLPVTANTDDKGIFSTSITNELSLVSSSKRACSNGNYPVGIVRQLVENGNRYRFNPNSNKLC